MNARWLVPLLVSSWVVGCQAPPPSSDAPGAAASRRSATPEVTPSAPPSASVAPPPSTSAMSDAELGALMTKLSERPGDFPSDNFVSNETSYLHVAAALDDPKLHGGALLGVGPEQIFTYAAILDPELVYVADIRRGNLVEHLVYKALLEGAPTRGAFVAALTSRAAREGAPSPSPAELAAWWTSAKKTPADEASTIDRVLARAAALSFPLDDADRRTLKKTVHAFATEGLDVRYSMEGSSRRYPSLAELLAIPDDAGKPRHFLATDEAYAKVRRLERENRVVPLVADLAGPSGLRDVAADLRARHVEVHVFYSSNVEQYLFSPKTTWQSWLGNLRALPFAPGAELLRVHFDQGKPHPAQRPGERTTTLLASEADFLARAESPGFRSYGEVVGRD